MCLEFLRGLNAFVVQVMLFISFNSNYDGFIHFVADHFTDLHFTCVTFFAHS
ncbi:hypothetical protein D3C80_2067800 [compost metagenome]